MAFDWKQCTVVMNVRKDKISKCWAVIKKFENRVTPEVYDGLKAYLEHLLKSGYVSKITPELLNSSIENLLRKCCNKDSIVLLMKSDVVKNEAIIVQHIKKAIIVSSYNTIYIEGDVRETYSEYEKRTSISKKDVKNIMKGVKQI